MIDSAYIRFPQSYDATFNNINKDNNARPFSYARTMTRTMRAGKYRMSSILSVLGWGIETYNYS